MKNLSLLNKKLLCVIAIMALTSTLLGQVCLTGSIESEPSDNPNTVYASRFGSYLPVSGNLRILIVFGEIEYINGGDPTPPNGTTGWPAHSLPTWVNQLTDPTIPSGNATGVITRYFQMASSGSFNVLGDYLLAPDNGGIFKMQTVMNHAITPWDSLDPNYHNANYFLRNEINSKMNQIITGHNLNSIDYFDLWTIPNSTGVLKTTPSTETPRKYDAVMFIWRNSAWNGTGYSTNGSAGNLIGYQSNSFSCFGTHNNIPTQIMIHEFSHGLYGGNNFHCGGGGWNEYFGDYFIPPIGGWSNLGLSGASLLTWNAWDRQRLDWKTPGNTYVVSARDANGSSEVNGDLDATISSQAGIYTVRDFVTTGDAIRIKLPFLNPSTEYPEYIWIENHNTKSRNGCDWDKFMFEEGNSCINGALYGLYAYLQIDREVRESTTKDNVFGGYAYYLRPLTANGYWDRLFESTTTQNNCINLAYYNAFTLYKQNPLTGGGDQDVGYSYNRNGNSTLEFDDIMGNYIELLNGTYLKNLVSNGHSRHVFTYAGNNKIGMGTNPSSATMMNMVGYSYYPEMPSYKNVRKISLNGVSIEIIEQNQSTGNIKVRIRFDDVDVNNDVRWCADEIVLNPIATSTGYSLNLTTGKTITLDQTLTDTRMNNPILFDGRNIFASPTVFNIKPNAKVHLEPNANIILNNGSTMNINSAASCVVEDNGTLEVKSGNTLYIDNCGTLAINGLGKFIARTGSTLCISPNAVLAFENGLQNLVVESGVTIPAGYVNPASIVQPTINNYTINANTPNWVSQSYLIAGVVTVEPGANFTIQSSTLKFSDINSKLVVKQGAKLTIDNSTLKNSCTGQWQGIEVWGTTNQYQFPINGVYAQGIVELKNGAIVENAANGITNWKPDDWNSIGGIIKAEGVTFKNCRRGVEFMKYRNFHPTSGYEMDNVSYFKDCSFIVDDNYPANASPFYTGVSLWSVRGIKFSGCDFFNNRTIKGSGYGIYSLDAGYKVYAICNSQASPCPEQYLDKTWFRGFEYGINASNTETSNSVYIQDSKFTENGYGIELSNVNNAVVLKNRFEMTSATNCPNYGYGINLLNCTGYAIEENLFTVNGVPPANNWSGIEITNSGTAYNEIYKNTFQNLTTGNLADLLNATTNTIPPTGLTYLCNTNTNNDYDFYVTNKPESRISYYQRSGTSTAAGNGFSQGANVNFHNGGGTQIRYYYSTGGAPQTYYGVVPVYTANTNTCPSHYGGGSGNLAQLNQSQMDALEALYADNYSAYNNVKSIYETLKDGGSTTNTVEDIETSMPSEMWELRVKLLGDSPHLSQTALKEAALKTDVLPESVLFEILSANPDEMRDESFLAFLESKENPLPSYMIDLLRAIAGNTSYKTVLQEQLNAFNTQKTLAASDIIRSKLNDSIVSQTDIINWFDNRGDLNSRYQMVDAYIQMGNYAAAQGMLSLIPGLHELSAADSADYQKVCELKNLQINILNAGRNLAMLTNTEKEQLSVIADANTGKASTQAKGILGFMAGTPYCNCVRYNDELKHSSAKPSTIVNLPSGIKISVAPNPATTWITFEYSLPEKLTSVTLTITDNTGKKVETISLTGKQGQKVLDIRTYASGAYIYQCNQDKKVSGKFIIK